MDRRSAIKSLAVTVAGVIFLPGCNFSNETQEAAKSFLSPEQDNLLAEIVEALIPSSEDIPGAKELKVNDYVKIMVADCREPEIHTIFLNGLSGVEKLAKENFSNSFSDLNKDQKIELLLMMQNYVEDEEASERKNYSQYYHLVKGLTVQGYMTSEFYMMNYGEYVAVPGPGYACVPVASKSIS